jgi:8-oxo-dGTP diphosphatase
MPAADQGVDLTRYMLVPRTLCFITRDDKVLLLKGGSTKRLWPGLYNGIGGHVEQGEDVITAAKRELWEETGMRVENLWLCGFITVDTQTNPGVGIFVFRGETSCVETDQSKDGTLEWIPLTKLSGLPLVADLPFILPRILKAKSDKGITIFHSHYDALGNLVVDIK